MAMLNPRFANRHECSDTRRGPSLAMGQEVCMNATEKTFATLQVELAFLDSGGYRRPVGSRQPFFCMESPVGWKHPLFFEDSPICPKRSYEMCTLERDCVLMDFVPLEDKLQKVPCRHIPLNERGESIASMARAGATTAQIEAALRKWLLATIDDLKNSVAEAAT